MSALWQKINFMKKYRIMYLDSWPVIGIECFPLELQFWV